MTGPRARRAEGGAIEHSAHRFSGRSVAYTLCCMSDVTVWEYATVPLLTHATKQILDQWGDSGWELVTVLPGPTGEQHVAYLKRPKN